MHNQELRILCKKTYWRGFNWWFSWSIKNKAIATQKLVISAVLCFLEYKNCSKHISLPRKMRSLSPAVSYDEYQYFLKKCRRNIKKLVVVKLLFETGIRASELLAIKVTDIWEGSIIINGKGKKQRICQHNFYRGLSEPHRLLRASKWSQSLLPICNPS